MKVKRKLPAFIMALLICAVVMCIPVFAATTTQDGLEVILTTDKQIYTPDEQITVSVSVNNTNNYDLSNVSLTSVIPEGYQLTEKTDNIRQIGELSAGEKVDFTFVYGKEQVSDAGSGKTDTSDESGAQSVSGEKSKVAATETGDSGDGIVWIGLFGASLLILILLYILRKKNVKRILSLFLIFSMAASIIVPADIEANAAPVTKTLENEFFVEVDEKPLSIKAVVDYSYDLTGLEYTVAFDSDGGTIVENQTVPYGEFAAEPEDPEKEGYIFDGWYNEAGEYFDFNEAVIGDVQLTASWLEITASEDDGFAENLGGESITPSTDGEVNEPLESLADSPITSVDVTYQLDNKGVVGIRELVSDPMLQTAGLVGLPVEIEAGGANVVNATITFHYDPALLEEDPANLAIVWFDEENNIATLLDDSIVDTENHTVSVSTTHFSRYGVVFRNIWDELWGKELPPMRTEAAPYYNVVLTMDHSGSMNGDKMSQSIQAAQNFVDVLADQDYISVITFNGSARTLVEPTAVNPEGSDNRSSIKNQISDIRASGGTNIEGALQLAMNYAVTDPQYQSLIVLISDGQSSVSDETITQLTDLGQKVVAVGIGSDTDEELMKKIADMTGGSYLHCDDAADIADAFIDLQNSYIGSTKDTDGDKLPDLLEIAGMRDQYGEIWTTDSENADSDGDGVNDGDEMGEFNALAASTYFSRVSRPDLYTVKSDEAYLMMPENMMYNFTEDNKLVVTVYVLDAHYRMAPDLLTPMEEDGIPKEYIYSTPQNLKVELLELPDDFHLESIETTAEETQGYSTYYKTTAVLSYERTANWQTVIWRVTADNCSEWTGYSENGIMANYIEKEQQVLSSSSTEDRNNHAKEETTENAEIMLARQAKIFIEKFSNSAKQRNNELESQNTTALVQFKSLYNSYQNNIPDQVYIAISEAVMEATKASKIDEYKVDEIHNQVAKQIMGGIRTLNEKIEVNGETYEVKGPIWAMAGVNTSFLTVSYSGHRVQLYSTSSQSEVAEALADYCQVLAQLNNDVWKDFISCYITDTFGLAGFESVAKYNVDQVLDRSEKVIKALCDKKYADDLTEEMGAIAQDKLSSWFSNKFKNFVEQTVPNGKAYIDASKEFKTAYKELQKYTDKLSEYVELLNSGASQDNLSKAESDKNKAYNQYITACRIFEDLVKAL